MSSHSDQVLKDHIDKEFDKNDFTHNGFLPPKNLHIYINEIFAMGGISIQVSREQAQAAWKKSDPNATGITKQGLYSTIKEIYWSHSKARQAETKTEVKKSTDFWSPPVKKRVETVETYAQGPPQPYNYAQQPAYYPPPSVSPRECVETVQESKRKKRGIGFEINFLGFDFGTGFNRGTKTKTEKHTRWF